MHPKLLTFDLFGDQHAVSTYGVLVAMGIMGGIYLGYRRSKQIGLRTEDYLDTMLWMLIASLAGSRLMFVLTNLQAFQKEPWRALYLWDGGLVFYGGVIAATLAAVYITWRRGMPYLRTCDVVAPFLALGHCLGRVGCFMAGCCWGKQCGPGWGVQFGPDSMVYQHMVTGRQLEASLHPVTPPLHAVQLYEATGEILIFFSLIVMQRFKRADGMVFFTYLTLYAILRATTELFRGDAARRFLFEAHIPSLSRLLGLPPGEPLLLSTSQFVALLTCAGGVAGLVWLWRRGTSARSAVR